MWLAPRYGRGAGPSLGKRRLQQRLGAFGHGELIRVDEVFKTAFSRNMTAVTSSKALGVGVAKAIAGRCLDVLVRSPVAREAMKTGATARLESIQILVLPTPTAWPMPSVTAPAQQVSWTGPPRPGGPLLLQSCSLLI